MTEKQAKLLAYPFTADEIEWRVLLTTKDKRKGQESDLKLFLPFLSRICIVTFYLHNRSRSP